MKRTLGCQQNVRPGAIAQTEDLLALQGVQLLWHEGAQVVPGAQAAAVVQAQGKDLGKTRGEMHIRFQHFQWEVEVV